MHPGVASVCPQKLKEGQKINFFGVRMAKTHMMYFDWGNRNLPEIVGFGQRRKDNFRPLWDLPKIKFTFFSNF